MYVINYSFLLWIYIQYINRKMYQMCKIFKEKYEKIERE